MFNYRTIPKDLSLYTYTTKLQSLPPHTGFVYKDKLFVTIKRTIRSKVRPFNVNCMLLEDVYKYSRTPASGYIEPHNLVKIIPPSTDV